MMEKDRRTGLPEEAPEPFEYEDIVGLPRPVSGRHAPMPLSSRAAQFAPFAALTGYEEAIGEAARLTAEETGETEMKR